MLSQVDVLSHSRKKKRKNKWMINTEGQTCPVRISPRKCWEVYKNIHILTSPVWSWQTLSVLRVQHRVWGSLTLYNHSHKHIPSLDGQIPSAFRLLPLVLASLSAPQAPGTSRAAHEWPQGAQKGSSLSAPTLWENPSCNRYSSGFQGHAGGRKMLVRVNPCWAILQRSTEK